MASQCNQPFCDGQHTGAAMSRNQCRTVVARTGALVKQALAGAQSQQKRSKKAASKARDMAREELDRLDDASLPQNERERRKRQLIKGPNEFRDMRADLPKPKD
jgi:hypothetical protein